MPQVASSPAHVTRRIPLQFTCDKNTFLENPEQATCTWRRIPDNEVDLFHENENSSKCGTPGAMAKQHLNAEIKREM